MSPVVPPHVLALRECDRCGLPTRVLFVRPSGEPDASPELVPVDPLPSLHGTVERVSLVSADAVRHDRRRFGWFRPHYETCTPEARS
jgi:hypothetical protein